jgi:hypothetical protein
VATEQAPPCTDEDEAEICEILVWAAAEVFRTDPTQTAARDYVDGFYADWANRCFDPARYDGYAAITYIQTPGATSAVVSNMEAGIINTLNWCVFPNEDRYRSGMPSYSYYWGSNAAGADHGLFLLAAAKLGLLPAGITADDLRDEARDYLHFFLGQNPLNMVYLTNMIDLGGEHSSWQFYHAWFSDSRSSYSSANFIGKPQAVGEPDYPYNKGTDTMGASDNNDSTYGPHPASCRGDRTPLRWRCHTAAQRRLRPAVLSRLVRADLRRLVRPAGKDVGDHREFHRVSGSLRCPGVLLHDRIHTEL